MLCRAHIDGVEIDLLDGNRSQFILLISDYALANGMKVNFLIPMRAPEKGEAP
jgi:hypothetical protein